MEWRNTEAALKAYGEEVVLRLQDKILDHEHVVSWNMAEHLTTEVKVTEDSIILYLYTEDYYKYVEEGIEPAGKYKNPGWKAYPFIRQWVIDKHIETELPGIKRASYLITRKHVEEGQEPDPMLRDILAEMEEKYMPIIEEAIGDDVLEEVNAILINGTLKGFYK